MAFCENQGARIYWDEQGKGEPVLLIMGLGYPSYLWHRMRPVLKERYRTIALDNRGSGQSDAPPGPYPIPLMASDAAAVLDAAAVETAAAGGPNAVRAEKQVTDVLLARNMSPEQAAKAMRPYIYDAGTPLERIEEDLVLRRNWFPRPEAYMAQLQGILAWEAYSRLQKISVPTLVIHGETDLLVPPGNGKLIASQIPAAKLTLLPRASHIFTTDQPEASHKAVLGFLAGQANAS
jgi:3-oxoadipate enol-lactonase